MTLTLAAWLELRKGMKTTKVNKPTKTGTKVTYTRLPNEELEGYIQDFISKNKPTFIAWLIKKGYVKGVYYDKGKGKYRPYMSFKGKQYKFGYYDTVEEAAKVRRLAEKEMHLPFLERLKNKENKQ